MFFTTLNYTILKVYFQLIIQFKRSKNLITNVEIVIIYLNLYLRGLSEHSGAGNPPQNETNEVICKKRKSSDSYTNILSLHLDWFDK